MSVRTKSMISNVCAQRSRADLGPSDLRLTYFPRFSEENFPKILTVVDIISGIAETHGATPGQVALAWLLAQGDNILPIPGSTKIAVSQNTSCFIAIRLSLMSIAEHQGERGGSAHQAHRSGGAEDPGCCRRCGLALVGGGRSSPLFASPRLSCAPDFFALTISSLSFSALYARCHTCRLCRCLVCFCFSVPIVMRIFLFSVQRV